jgi:predicted Zn-dependent peptidase
MRNLSGRLSPWLFAILSACPLWLSWPGGSLFGQERFRQSPPPPEPLHEWRLPAVESVRLSNGLTVAVAPRPESAQMCIQAVVLAGVADSPARVPGVAGFTASMASRGTPLLSSADVEEKIEALGAEFQVSVSMDYSLFSITVLEEHLDGALLLLSEMLLRPAFSERESESVRRTMFYELREKARDPEYVAKRLLLSVLFDGHPYRAAAFTEEAVMDVSPKDVLAFYDRYYRPNNTLLTIAGNVNLATAGRKVSHYFNTWREKKTDQFVPAPPSPSSKEQVGFIEFPGAKDVSIFLGYIIMPMSAPDYFPFIVLNQILGGTTNSRLFMNLRESREYAYYAFSGLDFFRSSGIFWVRAKVTPDVIMESIQEILKEVRAVASERIRPEEIEQAKSFLIGNFPLRNERLTDFSFMFSLNQAFGLGDDHWNRYYDNIMLVNLDRVLETGQKYLSPPPAVIIAGDRNLVIDNLRGFEKIDIYDSRGAVRSTINKGVEK